MSVRGNWRHVAWLENGQWRPARHGPSKTEAVACASVSRTATASSPSESDAGVPKRPAEPVGRCHKLAQVPPAGDCDVRRWSHVEQLRAAQLGFRQKTTQWTAGMRKERPFADGVANASDRPLAAF
jgi:hypothetical protein